MPPGIFRPSERVEQVRSGTSYYYFLETIQGKPNPDNCLLASNSTLSHPSPTPYNVAAAYNAPWVYSTMIQASIFHPITLVLIPGDVSKKEKNKTPANASHTEALETRKPYLVSFQPPSPRHLQQDVITKARFLFPQTFINSPNSPPEYPQTPPSA